MARFTRMVFLGFLVGSLGLVAGCGDDDDDAAGDGDADADSDADADTDADADGDGDGDADLCLPADLTIAEITDGSTEGEPSHLDASCGDSAGQADALYRVDHGEGVLTIQVETDGFDAVLELLDACDAPIDGACRDEYVTSESIVQCVDAGSTLVLVDGYGDGRFDAQQGAFTITAELSPPCADGESCIEGIGCATDLPGGDTCDDPVDLPLEMTIDGETTGLADDVQGTCFGGDGADVVYQVTVPSAGALTLDLLADFDAAVLVRTSCADAKSEVDCSAEQVPLGSCVDAGTYSVVVDGETGGLFGASEGLYVLSASFEACEGEEACVDGGCYLPTIPEAEPNDDFGTAQVVTDGSRIRAAIEGEGANDYYAVTLTAGQTLHADTLERCTMDTEVFVYGAPLPDPPPDTFDGCDDLDPTPALACDSDSGDAYCSDLSFVAPADGTYYIRVIDWEGDEAGDYVLVIGIE